MKIHEILIEKNYRGPFYHFTSPGNIVGILTKEKFWLSKSSHSTEHRLQKKFKRFDYPYYLSVARSTTSNAKQIGLLVLDPMFFYNKREFKPEAVDWTHFYYDEFGDLPPGGETEERIWSKVETVSYECIREIHIHAGGDFVPSYAYNDSKYANFIYAEREAKKKGIPCYTYIDDPKAYMSLAKHRATQDFEKLIFSEPQDTAGSSPDEENYKSSMVAMNDLMLGRKK